MQPGSLELELLELELLELELLELELLELELLELELLELQSLVLCNREWECNSLRRCHNVDIDCILHDMELV
jgi:hypothetical protein